MSGQNNFLPAPGRFGVMPVLLTSGRINTGTLAAGTQQHDIGGYPAVPVQVDAACVAAGTWPTAATSCTIKLVKYDASASTAVDLTAAVDINDKTDGTSLQMPLLSTLTVPQLTMDPGDVLNLVLVTTGAVSQQPDDIVVTVELLVLR